MESGLIYFFSFVITFISSFIHGSIGFGYAIFAMSILPLVLPLRIAAVVVNISLLITTLQMSFQLRKYINYNFIIVPLLFAILGRTLGVYLLMNIEASFLEKLLGGLLIVLSIYMYILKNKIKVQPSIGKGAVLGFSSGLLGGMYNLGGPPIVLYYFSALKDKMVYAASLQATFLITTLYGVGQHLYYGNITPMIIKVSIINIVAVIVGCKLGVSVLKKMSRETMGKLLYLYMAIMGLFIVIKS